MKTEHVPTILFVEDDEMDTDLMERAFARAGKTVNLHAVADGQACLDHLQSIQDEPNASLPDMIFLDINLPKVNGLTILKEIGKSKHLSGVPTLIISSSRNPRDVQSCYEAHCSAYLVKPDRLKDWEEMARSIASFWFGIVHYPERTTPRIGPAS